MEYYKPKLQKQPSCSPFSLSCPPFDITSCFSYRRRAQFTRGIPDDDESDFGLDTGCYPLSASAPDNPKWRGIWRRIAKEKRRIFVCGAPVHEPYDAYSYAQNFDEGSVWIEPENLSRSFSARFAVPSTMLRRLS